MKYLRFLLFPLALIYKMVTDVRNFLYDINWFKSKGFQLPIVLVGNLSVGGTGKTPMIEYLVQLLSETYKITILSRGYKRQSKGFVLADENATVEQIGDEPFQYFSKFKNCSVCVCENRVEGIENILKILPQTELVLLDDAFQHRRIKAKVSILLTPFDALYCNDFLLPTGNLRESRKGAERAEAIIVTKCPENLTQEQQKDVLLKLKVNSDQKVFFSSICYDAFVYNKNSKIKLEEIPLKNRFALTGIARPTYFLEKLKVNSENSLSFSDHHHFTASDLKKIIHKANDKIIITTEKDYMRLGNKEIGAKIYFLPITISLDKPEEFRKWLLNRI